ncbi:MAG: TetR family transcriptional regulator [Pseudomonadota bacterium]
MIHSGKKHRRKDNKPIDTRQALFDAVLELMSRDKSFDAISLREVTREVGINPSAFYRHFPDMNSLGLELVNLSFKTLRQHLKDVRANPVQDANVVRESVETFVSYVLAHPRQFQFIIRAQVGGAASIRAEIESEHRLLVSELSTDLARRFDAASWSTEELQMLADLMIGAMTRIVEQLLIENRHSASQAALTELAEKQLQLILLGAMHWHDQP